MVHLVLKSIQRYCKLLQACVFCLFLKRSKHLITVVLLCNKLKKQIKLDVENVNIKITCMLARLCRSLLKS